MRIRKSIVTLSTIVSLMLSSMSPVTTTLALDISNSGVVDSIKVDNIDPETLTGQLNIHFSEKPGTDIKPGDTINIKLPKDDDLALKFPQEPGTSWDLKDGSGTVLAKITINSDDEATITFTDGVASLENVNGYATIDLGFAPKIATGQPGDNPNASIETDFGIPDVPKETISIPKPNYPIDKSGKVQKGKITWNITGMIDTEFDEHTEVEDDVSENQVIDWNSVKITILDDAQSVDYEWALGETYDLDEFEESGLGRIERDEENPNKFKIKI